MVGQNVGKISIRLAFCNTSGKSPVFELSVLRLASIALAACQPVRFSLVN